jgi:hypothetical protein
MLLSDAAKPSATSNDKNNGTQSLSTYVSGLQTLCLRFTVPVTRHRTRLDNRCARLHFRCTHFQMPVILHFVAHRGFLCPLDFFVMCPALNFHSTWHTPSSSSALSPTHRRIGPPKLFRKSPDFGPFFRLACR